jgi:hypothetical protein
MSGTKLMIYASGYASPYVNDPQEVAYAQASPSIWAPSTVDFQATARRSGAPSGASSVADMLAIIASMAVGSISLLGLIGHGADADPSGTVPRSFGFAGRVQTRHPYVTLTGAGLLNSTTIAAAGTAATALHNRFATNARIVLYACTTGSDNTLLDPISRAFGVCVDGFADEVNWCFEWATPSLTINTSTRGKVFFDNAKLSVLPSRIPCAGYAPDATMLKPDVTSCVGVATPSAPAARRAAGR